MKLNFARFALTAVLSLLTSAALADHDLLSATETVDIDARPHKVWQRIRNFNGLNEWHPAVAKSNLVNGQNNKPGAVRELTITNGAIIYDELVAIDDERMYYVYKLVDSPLPATEYQSTVAVKPKGAGAQVIWTVTFRRKNPIAHPPADQTDAAAIQLLEGVYRAGIDNLKKIIEGKN